MGPFCGRPRHGIMKDVSHLGNMAIVSLSLPDDLVADMDHAIQEGYRGRSEFMRAAIRTHLQAAQRLTGDHSHGSITVVYAHGNEPAVSEVRHAFHDVVLSLMHTHCEPDVCMDVLLVGGSADRILELEAALQRMRDVKRAVLVPAPA